MTALQKDDAALLLADAVLKIDDPARARGDTDWKVRATGGGSGGGLALGEDGLGSGEVG
jgi:hypothetical protein